MKFTWIKPKEASTEELEDQLKAAKGSHLAAVEAVAAAQDAFDADGDDNAAKALAKAREVAEYATEHLCRAERLLAAARERAAAAERAELERLEVELKAKRLDHGRDDELVNEIVQVCERLIDAQARRLELYSENSKLDGHIHSVRLKLGHATDFRFDPLDYVPSQYPVVQKLNASVQADEPNKERNRLRYSLANLLQQWR
jgi:hypothetical protein